ncbi:MAG: hypothetical protein JSS34_00520, partial [Proteobacteria bacterium]|nr:hypothetical protein [Pseudomonadota bacterium]
YLFNINGDIREGKLQVFWSYSTLHYKDETVENVSHTFLQKLQDIIPHCLLDKNIPDYTMSDFPDFEPYVIVNNSKNEAKNNLFIFPPGHGGSESYFNNIVPELNNKNLILFNNYYNYFENKIDKNYLNYITIENLARDYIIYIKLLQPEGPYNLFGWSLGGTLAFEVAKQLIKKRELVTNIILIDPYFNLKEAVLKIGKNFEDVTHVNYKYFPAPTSDLSKTNITLFKASKIEDAMEDEKGFFKYYVENTKYNHLDKLIKNTKIRVIKMHAGHSSWINNDTEIVKICNVIKSLI